DGKVLQGTQAPEWDASRLLPLPDQRRIITPNSNGQGVGFRWESLDGTRRSELAANPQTARGYIQHLRGRDSVPGLRRRATGLGAIINSAPIYVGAPRSRYSDALEPVPYSSFLRDRADRAPMVYVGANDGMLHGFDALTGVERLAFIPGTVFP